jgi:3-methyladenine DNA glycosylase/8-oxoguanine DNA glycosylase
MPPRQTKAIAHLKAVDPILGVWIDRAGPCGWEVKADGTHFDHVARSIVYQQVSGAAAATVYGRMLGLYRGKAPTPKQVLATPDEQLRGVGLSGRKVEYIKGLAEQLVAKRLPLEQIDGMSDDEVIATLTSIRGIGEWTAQMVLMFRLGRPDVLPTLDIALQRGVKVLYGLRTQPSPDRLAKIGAKWAPYRTVASWYLWRRVDDRDDW